MVCGVHGERVGSVREVGGLRSGANDALTRATAGMRARAPTFRGVSGGGCPRVLDPKEAREAYVHGWMGQRQAWGRCGHVQCVRLLPVVVWGGGFGGRLAAPAHRLRPGAHVRGARRRQFGVRGGRAAPAGGAGHQLECVCGRAGHGRSAHVRVYVGRGAVAARQGALWSHLRHRHHRLPEHLPGAEPDGHHRVGLVPNGERARVRPATDCVASAGDAPTATDQFASGLRGAGRGLVHRHFQPHFHGGAGDEARQLGAGGLPRRPVVHLVRPDHGVLMQQQQRQQQIPKPRAADVAQGDARILGHLFGHLDQLASPLLSHRRHGDADQVAVGGRRQAQVALDDGLLDLHDGGLVVRLDLDEVGGGRRYAGQLRQRRLEAVVVDYDAVEDGGGRTAGADGGQVGAQRVERLLHLGVGVGADRLDRVVVDHGQATAAASAKREKQRPAAAAVREWTPRRLRRKRRHCEKRHGKRRHGRSDRVNPRATAPDRALAFSSKNNRVSDGCPPLAHADAPLHSVLGLRAPH
eukprot:ctg_204.g148